MRRVIMSGGLALALLASAVWEAQGEGLSKLPAKEALPADLTVHAWMSTIIAPQSTLVWNTSSKAINDDGAPDGSKMTAGDWSQIIGAAEQIRGAASQLAATPKVIVAVPGVKIQDEGNDGSSSAAQVQARVVKELPVFKASTRRLEAIAKDFISAAKTRDPVKLSTASDRLDGVCEDCHMHFWYPEQQSPLNPTPPLHGGAGK